MKQIPLTQGKFALVDDCDFDSLSMFKWYAYRDRKNDRWYARRSVLRDGKIVSIRMHRVIMDAKPGKIIDHRDRDGLNNQRHNLRFCTFSQNAMNKKTRNASGFKGVYRYGGGNCGWISLIRVDGKLKYLGTFESPELAAHAYDSAAVEHFGEFARPNSA